MNPPSEANDLLKVPITTSTWSSTPKYSAVPRPFRAQHPEAVRVVDHDPGAVLLGQSADRRQVGQVAFHAEDAVDHDQDPALAGDRLQEPFQVDHVVVLVLEGLGKGQTGAVKDAGVVLAVADDEVALARQRRDDAQVGLEPGAEDQGGLAPHEAGQPLFEFHVEIQIAVEKAGSRAARAVFCQGLRGGLLDPGIAGQAEVVVGPDHDYLLLVDDDLGVLSGLKLMEIRVDTRGHSLAGGGEIEAFLEEIQAKAPPVGKE